MQPNGNAIFLTDSGAIFEEGWFSHFILRGAYDMEEKLLKYFDVRKCIKGGIL